jgi:DnaJ-class molecular chaperone
MQGAAVLNDPSNDDHYSTLGVLRSATSRVVMAESKKSLMVHPDKHPNAAAADHLLFYAAQLRLNEIVAVMQDEASRSLTTVSSKCSMKSTRYPTSPS